MNLRDRFKAMMRLLELRRFLPRRWKGLRHYPSYIRFRLDVHGRRPTLGETWNYLGWCQEANRAARAIQRAAMRVA